MLCPCCSHEAVGRVKDTAGEEVAVSVARLDPPGNVLMTRVLIQDGLLSKETLMGNLLES